ncbi:MAG: translation initiation factor IF-2 [SAR86 cluster bacterium SAR86B]|uniref:Translation initiation factor IF-2 n=1 Tax=SAR86 cluster bacterium SAR86B TaxID=1123867 RepID=J5KQ74_9GAMM|nr:MAG: translation initiation factor IF-2 [SAR86 cluster bacterium SAR86B]
MSVTVKDFAKTLKISDKVLLERMQLAGLSHKTADDEVTPADKQALLKYLKGNTKTSTVKVGSSGVNVTAKPSAKSASNDSGSTSNYSDDIEAKRAAATEQLRIEQKKREDQLKQAAENKRNEILRKKQAAQSSKKPAVKVDVKEQLSKAVNAYKGRDESFPESSHKFEAPTEFIQKDIEVPEMIQVGELAKLMAIKAAEVVKNLMSLGVVATINDVIDQETALLVVDEIGHNGIAIKESDIEENFASAITYNDEPEERSPVITVMGHVDHGKTTLLDYIRKTKVVDGEAGGITQHIGAYQVDTSKGRITFIDTPGHAAFSSMRARGANTTDIVILVVAANDGIKPQTEEAINHAKAADVSIVVAINKIDLDGADVEKVKGDLAGKDLVPEDWGGNIQMVPVSAITGEGIDDLLERISLEAELLELKAHYKGPAQGVVIESELDKFKGAVATFLIQNGTLKVGDLVASGNVIGKIKSIVDSDGSKSKNAGPSSAVEVLGLNGVPNAGDQFQVVESEKQAREIAEYRITKEKERKLLKQKDELAGNLFETLGQSDRKILNVILKTDVGGTREAIAAALDEVGNEDAKIKIISSGVGGISGSDANLAIASEAVLIGFNVRADSAAKKIIEDEGLSLTYHSIIYELLDDVKARLSGLLDPIVKEEIVGTAEVLEVFNSPKFGQVAGCKVIEGNVYRNKPVRVLRDEVVIFEGELNSLRRFKDDVGEVQNGNECGMGIKNYKDIKPGDKIEVFDRKEEAQTI